MPEVAPGRNGPSGIELRTHARASIDLDVDVSLDSESQFFAGLTHDISAGGLFIATYRPMPIGARVSLKMTLPDGPLEATGVVRWTRDTNAGAVPGVGIAFDGLDDAATARIATFCDLRAPLYYELDDA